MSPAEILLWKKNVIKTFCLCLCTDHISAIYFCTLGFIVLFIGCFSSQIFPVTTVVSVDYMSKHYTVHKNNVTLHHSRWL